MNPKQRAIKHFPFSGFALFAAGMNSLRKSSAFSGFSISRWMNCYVSAGFLFCFISLQSAAQQHGNRAGCFPTTWPVDMANNNRSNTVTDCGFPSPFDSSLIQYTSIQLPFPAFSYSRESDEVFVMGGCPLVLFNYGAAIETGQPSSPPVSYTSQFVPYIARITPSTLIADTLHLTGGAAAPYIGGAVMHANGYIYAMAAGRLFKIQASPFQVVSWSDLPTYGFSQLNLFNGISVSRSGRIVAKTYNQIAGRGFLFLVEEGSLAVVDQLDLALASPRLTLDIHANREYIYHLNTDYTFRVEIVNDSLRPDSTWIAAYDPYNTNSSDEPTSPVICGDQVFYTTNTLYSSNTPMKIFWQSKIQNYSSADTLHGSFLHSDTINPGWSFFHLSIDDTISNIIISNDQGRGRIAAGLLDTNNQYLLLWEKFITTSARPAIVADRRHVYVSDFVNGADHLVVLDLLTGQELARKSTLAVKPTIGTIIITPDDYVVYASNEYGNSLGWVNMFRVPQVINGVAFSGQANTDPVIYPNPGYDEINIRFSCHDYDYMLFDSLGGLVLHAEHVSGNQLLDLSNKQEGIYFMVFKYGDQSSTFKLSLFK